MNSGGRTAPTPAPSWSRTCAPIHSVPRTASPSILTSQRSETNSSYASPFRLVKTDGTGPGTEFVSGTTGPKHIVASGGSIFYAGTGSNNGKLFRTDGTAGGTVEVIDFDHPSASAPTDLTDFGGILHFAVDDGVNGEELWRSDGTLAGTERLTDINPAGGSNTANLRALGDRLYFSADDNGATGREVWQVYSDSTPPETTIDSGPAEGSTIEVGEVTFTFSSNEPGSTFTCSLDGATPQACNSGSKTYSAIGEGPHTFSVTATDPAPFSNVDPTPAIRNFTFTDPPPETTIDSGPAEGSTIEVDQATFTFSSNEPGSTFSCSLDGGTPEPCDSGSKTYTGLSEGAHAFSVAATGPAPFTKVDPTPATRNFTYTEPPPIDSTPPETTIDSGPAEGLDDRGRSGHLHFLVERAGLDLQLLARRRHAGAMRLRQQDLHRPERRCACFLGGRHRPGTLQQRRSNAGDPELHLHRSNDPSDH